MQDLETIIRASHQLQDSKVFSGVLEVGCSSDISLLHFVHTSLMLTAISDLLVVD